MSGTTTLEDRIHFLDTIELVSSGQADFVDATDEFLRAHPQSPFRVWIGVSAGWRAFGQRRFTLAQQLFEMMPPSNATAAIYLARLYVLKGDYELARNALAAVNIARLSNPLLFQYDIVSQALDYESRGEPWKSWSGHYAVMDLARDLGWDVARLKELLSDPPKDGTQILQLRDWAQEKGLELDVVVREPGSINAIRGIVLWKHGHYGALVGIGGEIVAGNRFDSRIALSNSLLDEEALGYFLVPAGMDLPEGWSRVPDEEVLHVAGERFAAQQIQLPLRPQLTLNIAPTAQGQLGEFELRISGNPGQYRLMFAPSLEKEAWDFSREITLFEGQATVIPWGPPNGGRPLFFRVEGF